MSETVETLAKMAMPNVMIKEQLDRETDNGKVIWVENNKGEKTKTTIGELKERVAGTDKLLRSMKQVEGEQATYTVDEGKMSMDELSTKKDLGGLAGKEKEDEVGKSSIKAYVGMAKYCLEVLESAKLVPSGLKILSLKSNDKYPEMLHETSSIPKHSVISLASPETGEKTNIEIKIEYDPEYLEPGIAVVNAWTLDSVEPGKQNRIATLEPLPKMRKIFKWKGYTVEELIFYARALGVLCLVCGVAIFVVDITGKKKTE